MDYVVRPPNRLKALGLLIGPACLLARGFSHGSRSNILKPFMPVRGLKVSPDDDDEAKRCLAFAGISFHEPLRGLRKTLDNPQGMLVLPDVTSTGACFFQAKHIGNLASQYMGRKEVGNQPRRETWLVIKRSIIHHPSLHSSLAFMSFGFFILIVFLSACPTVTDKNGARCKHKKEKEEGDCQDIVFHKHASPIPFHSITH